MAYYHVRFMQQSTIGPNDEVTLALSIEQLKQRTVDPYRQDQPITISGKTLTTDDYEHVTITKTSREFSNLRSKIRLLPTVKGFPKDSLLASHIERQGEDVTDEFLIGPPGHAQERGPQASQASLPPANKREIFVVHGRNEEARNAIFAFLKSIGFDPLEWSRVVKSTGKASPYIGEIVDDAFSRQNVFVVLFTPDDEARLKDQFWADSEPPYETQLSGQARPNVLFEAGRAMERDSERTILVELGDLRPFNDIAGRHAIRLDNTPQQRKELAQRLQTAGCPVKLDGDDWLTTGDFESAVAEESDSVAPQLEQAPEVPTIPPISDDAKELLLEAALSARNTIAAYKVMASLAIHIGDRIFAEPGDRRSEVRWKRAIEELEQAGLVEALSYKAQAFQLTHAGFTMADALNESLKGTPTVPQ